jgi:hypothetical protein
MLTGAPSEKLPSGLVARVEASRRSGRQTILSIVPVPISEAVPEFSSDTPIALSPPLGAQSAAAHAAEAKCDGPKTLDVGASLDQFEIRQSSASLWPPEMSFTLAARTTEHAGLKLAAAGVSCTWALAELGPWRGAIPTPIGVPIPVYASVPIEADADIEGSLSAFEINLASTHVVSVALGHSNNFSFQEQGSNVWTDGVLQLSGKAEIGLSMSLEFGVGDPEAGNLHVDVGFGPKVSWESGAGCEVDVNLGSVSAGVKIGPLSASTPSWTPFTIPLWHGCTDSSNGGTGSTPPGGGSTPPGGGSTPPGGGSTPPGGGSTPTSGGSTPTVPSGSYAETVGGVTHTWTDYTSAGGTQGSSIQTGQTVGVTCKVQGFRVADGDSWWYQVASSPWSNGYYASADAFYNNGQTSGSLSGTPAVDPNVPNCGSGTPPPASTPAGTYPETVGGVTHTWTNYANAGGTQGPSVQTGQTVGVTCKVQGFTVADGDTWWYEIAASPWSNAYYASADAFYNDGATSGSLVGTPFVDSNVPTCGSSAPPPPPPATYAETVGGVTHTWTNYTNAGGTQGPSIPTSQTVQVACAIQGFTVADGDTWWYRIASSPWNSSYYASADAFYNNGATSGSLHGTPFVDNAVPGC